MLCDSAIFAGIEPDILQAINTHSYHRSRTSGSLAATIIQYIVKLVYIFIFSIFLHIYIFLLFSILMISSDHTFAIFCSVLLHAFHRFELFFELAKFLI